jgi:hypothetical protein
VTLGEGSNESRVLVRDKPNCFFFVVTSFSFSGWSLRRAALAPLCLACVGVVVLVVLVSDDVFALVLLSVLQCPLEFVGHAWFMFFGGENLHLPLRLVGPPVGRAKLRPPGRLSLFYCHSTVMASRRNRIASVIDPAPRGEGCGSICRWGMVICQQFCVLSVGGSTLLESADPGLDGSASLSQPTVLLAMVVPLRSAPASALPEDSSQGLAREKTLSIFLYF